MKKIGKNLSRALCIIIYFIILFFAYTRMNLDRLAQDIQVFSGAFFNIRNISIRKSLQKRQWRSSNYRDRTISFIYILFIYYAYDNIIEI